MTALPEEFKSRMKRLLGGDYDAFIACFDEPPVRGIRVNTLKVSVERFVQICPWSIEPAPTLREGLILTGEAEHIGLHPYHAAGLFYAQEPSAMSVIDEAEIESGMRVLDLCAAPGGKSGGIAERLNGSGLLVSNEIVRKRAAQLARNLERLGSVNAVVTCAHPDAIASALPLYFDRVVVDAPCSGEGMFRKDPTAIAEWSAEHVAACAKRQEAILDSAACCVAPAGKLIYSTCTFSEEENEMTIEAFLCRHPDFVLEVSRRLYPHTLRGEGHFVARLKRVSCGEEAPAPTIGKRVFREAAKNEAGAALAYMDEVFTGISADTLKSRLYTMNERVYYMPEALPEALFSLPVVCPGVEIGELSPARFKPSHALFMAAHGFEYRDALDLTLGCAETAAFLRGETVLLGGDKRGYMPVRVDSFPVGFCKVVDGVAKNHLPKGLVMNWR